MGVTAPLDLQAWILKNLALGAVVSSLLVALLGYGTIAFSAAITPPEAGVNIGAAILASLGCLLAVALGAAFTAWRARRRGSQPIPEGATAGLVGFTLAGGGRLPVLRRRRRASLGDRQCGTTPAAWDRRGLGRCRARQPPKRQASLLVIRCMADWVHQQAHTNQPPGAKDALESHDGRG
jgi:hypothetical protein